MSKKRKIASGDSDVIDTEISEKSKGLHYLTSFFGKNYRSRFGNTFYDYFTSISRCIEIERIPLHEIYITDYCPTITLECGRSVGDFRLAGFYFKPKITRVRGNDPYREARLNDKDSRYLYDYAVDEGLVSQQELRLFKGMGAKLLRLLLRSMIDRGVMLKSSILTAEARFEHFVFFPHFCTYSLLHFACFG
jgi:hypothetical protein